MKFKECGYDLLDKIKKDQFGMIHSPGQCDQLEQSNPGQLIYCKVKGKHGDRGVLEMDIKTFNSGAFILEGEFVSQVWIKEAK